MNAYEYLQRKGIRKIHQPNKVYVLSVGELVDFLEEYSRTRKEEIGRMLLDDLPLFRTGKKQDI